MLGEAMMGRREARRGEERIGNNRKYRRELHKGEDHIINCKTIYAKRRAVAVIMI